MKKDKILMKIWVKFKQMKYRRNMKDRIIAGLAAGVADLAHIDPTWIRLLFILLAILFFPFFIIIYVIAAAVVPQTEEVVDVKKFHRVRENKMLRGVCTGLAKHFEIDVVWIRLLFLFSLAFQGFGVLLYLALWVISPIDTPKLKAIAS